MLKEEEQSFGSESNSSRKKSFFIIAFIILGITVLAVIMLWFIRIQKDAKSVSGDIDESQIGYKERAESLETCAEQEKISPICGIIFKEADLPFACNSLSTELKDRCYASTAYLKRDSAYCSLIENSSLNEECKRSTPLTTGLPGQPFIPT